MKAVFVTNQRKTVFFDAVARRMLQLGDEIYWISVSKLWTAWLVKQGWPRERILSLPDFGPEWTSAQAPTKADAERINRIEASSETSLKNIVIMDRELNKWPGSRAETYVYVVLREVERFIRINGIRWGFGEITWACEMLTSEVLRASGGRYFMHHTVRIPSSRFGFFEGIFHGRLAHLAAPNAAHRELARQVMTRVRDSGEKPYYFAKNMNPQRFRSWWLEEAFTAALRPDVHRYDHSVPGLLTRSLRRIRKRVMARVALRSPKFESPDLESARPFVLVTLHVQPESSVDVFGNAMSNQLEAIRALARLLPFGFELWVKEHGHAVGDRSPSCYKALKALPGLRLIDPSCDTGMLIRRARLVVSVAGTACFEAAVMGVPAATLGDLLWKPILVANGLNPYGMHHGDMVELLDRADEWRSAPDRDREIEEFLTWMVGQSVEGIISDPSSDPTCMTAENIEKVAVATSALIRSGRPASPRARQRDDILGGRAA